MKNCNDRRVKENTNKINITITLVKTSTSFVTLFNSVSISYSYVMIGNRSTIMISKIKKKGMRRYRKIGNCLENFIAIFHSL